MIRPTGPSSIGWTAGLRGPAMFFAYPACEPLAFNDGNGGLRPALATSWEVDPNGKFVIFKLRQGVKFHDGTDFNAEAAKYNLDLLMKEMPGELSGVTSVDVVDKYTIKMNTDFFSQMLFANIPGRTKMSSPTQLAKGKEAVQFNPVGTGPFKFVDFKRDVYLKYERNDNYWGEGKPYLDGIEFTFIPEAMTASASFQAGDADMLDRVSYKEASDLLEKGYKSISFVGTVAGFAPDTANPGSVFADKKVREALEYAIDREEIAKIGLGFLDARNQLMMPGALGYVEGLGRSYDPAKAKQLLSEAGHPNGFETTLICSTQYTDRDVAVAIQSYLADVGIKAELEFADPGRWNEYVYKSGWKDALVWMSSGSGNPILLTNFIMGTSRTDYISMTRPAGSEALLQEIISTPDLKIVNEKLQQMTKMIYDDATFIPLFGNRSVCIQQPYVNDTGVYGFNSTIDWTPEDAWLAAK